MSTTLRRAVPQVTRADLEAMAAAAEFAELGRQPGDKNTPFAITWQIGPHTTLGWVEDPTLGFPYLAFGGERVPELEALVCRTTRCVSVGKLCETAAQAPDLHDRVRAVLALGVTCPPPALERGVWLQALDAAMLDEVAAIRAAALVAIRYVDDFPADCVRRVATDDPEPALRAEADTWLRGRESLS